MARVTVDDKSLQKRLAEIGKRAKDCSQFTKTASIRMHGDVMKHFQTESAPDGKWHRWSAKYAAARARGRGGNKILQDTGQLRGSIGFSNTSKTASVGTNLVYAPTHQYGDSARNIPKREFLWVSPALFQDIAVRFTKFISEGAV